MPFKIWISVILGVFMSTFFFTSCTQSTDFSTDASGIEYLFYIQNNENLQAQLTDVLSVNMRITNDADSILFDGPYKIQFAEPSHDGGSIEDAIGMMHKGDSASFYINAQNFYTYTLKKPIDFACTPNSKLQFDIKLKDITPYSEIMAEFEHQKEVDTYEEMRILDSYIQSTGIVQEPSMSGLYKIVIKEGNGKMATPGSVVAVNYTGALIDGTIFQSTFDKGKPLGFVLGKGKVIQGWDEGITGMKEGERIKLIIPSHLAYGEEGFPPVIPPYSTLIFEIELVSVVEQK